MPKKAREIWIPATNPNMDDIVPWGTALEETALRSGLFFGVGFAGLVIALASAATVGGGTVYAQPLTTIDIPETLTIPSNVTFDLQGSTLRATGVRRNDFIIYEQGGQKHGIINGKIDANDLIENPAVLCNDFTNAFIKNIEIVNWRYGFQFQALTTPSSGLLIENVYVHSPRAANAHPVNVALYNTVYPAWVTGGDLHNEITKVQMINSDIIGKGGDYQSRNGTADQIAFQNVNGFIVENCLSNYGGENGQAYGRGCQNGKIINCSASFNDGHGLQIGSAAVTATINPVATGVVATPSVNLNLPETTGLVIGTIYTGSLSLASGTVDSIGAALPDGSFNVALRSVSGIWQDDDAINAINIKTVEYVMPDGRNGNFDKKIGTTLFLKTLSAKLVVGDFVGGHEITSVTYGGNISVIGGTFTNNSINKAARLTLGSITGLTTGLPITGSVTGTTAVIHRAYATAAGFFADISNQVGTGFTVADVIGPSSNTITNVIPSSISGMLLTYIEGLNRVESVTATDTMPPGSKTQAYGMNTANANVDLGSNNFEGNRFDTALASKSAVTANGVKWFQDSVALPALAPGASSSVTLTGDGITSGANDAIIVDGSGSQGITWSAISQGAGIIRVFFENSTSTTTIAGTVNISIRAEPKPPTLGTTPDVTQSFGDVVTVLDKTGAKRFALAADTAPVVSSTVLVASGLTVPVEASTKYYVEAFLLYLTPATAQMDVTLNAPVLSAGGFSIANPANTVAFTTAGANELLVSGGGAVVRDVKIRGILRVGTNAGNLTLSFAQNVSDAGSTLIESGSWLRVEKLT